MAPPKAKPMSELIQDLSGILTKESILNLTAKKQPCPKTTTACTTGKIRKPMTLAEMEADLKGLRAQSPRKMPQVATSTKRKWNSSVKLQNKVVSHTAAGKMKHNSVRKVLNFQQTKPKAGFTEVTMDSTTPKFCKPELKRPLHLQANNNIRMSGICRIDDTPAIKSTVHSKMPNANKENIPTQPFVKKIPTTPKSSLHERVVAKKFVDTPLTNESWKSTCDGSFLQNEKDIEFIEGKIKTLSEEHTLEDIAEVSPPVLSPFKEYRNIDDFFNNSSNAMDMDSSTVYQDNTIMSLDRTPPQENSKREESVIVTLCDMLDKATVSNLINEKSNHSELDLLKLERQISNQIKLIENGIATLMNLRQLELKSLHDVRKQINGQRNSAASDNTTDLKDPIQDIKNEKTTHQNAPVDNTCSVIKSFNKSPSYKLPKKNALSIRKKVLHKSIPKVSNLAKTPPKQMGDSAFSMYMQMKGKMNFLTTPKVKSSSSSIGGSTPAISNNLQLQLERMFGESLS